MDYTLHQLKVFLSVAEYKSVTKAAQNLHLTQPAVSIQLKKLQDQFDIPLVEVIGRQLYITEFGQEIVLAAKRILKEVSIIDNTTRAYKGFMVGHLKFSIVSTGKYVMPFFLTDFSGIHPEVELVMDVTNKATVLKSLEKNEIDFALVSVLPVFPQVNRIQLMKNELYLVRKYQGDNRGLLKGADLEHLPLIYREKGSATRLAMEEFISKHNIPKRKTFELTSNEAVKQAVIAGLGYSIMPLIGIKNEIADKQLEIIPIRHLPITTQWNLIWLKDKKPSPIAQAYLEFIKEQKNQVIIDHFKWYEEYDG